MLGPECMRGRETVDSARGLHGVFAVLLHLPMWGKRVISSDGMKSTSMTNALP